MKTLTLKLVVVSSIAVILSACSGNNGTNNTTACNNLAYQNTGLGYNTGYNTAYNGNCSSAYGALGAGGSTVCNSNTQGAFYSPQLQKEAWCNGLTAATGGNCSGWQLVNVSTGVTVYCQ